MAHAKDRLHQLGPLCAYQASKAQNLSSAQLERTALERTLVDAGIFLYFQKDLANRRIILRRVDVRQLAAHHLLDDLLIRDVIHIPGSDICTVTHNRDIITDLTNLCHLVGNVHQRYASGFQIPDNAEESFYFIICKRGGRLIQNHYPGLQRNCLGNLHGLHLCDGHRTEFRLGIVRHLHVIQPFGRLLKHFFVVYHLKRPEFLRRITAGIHVLRNRSLRNRLQLLMHHRQSFMQRLIRIVNLHTLAIQINLTLIHMINTKQAFHQSGFSCTVLSHQRMDSTRTDVQVDLIQSLYPREAFGNPPHFQSVLCHPILSFHKIGCALQTHPTLFFYPCYSGLI